MNKHLSAIRKAGFGSLFTPTKAIRRVRAIAAYRTQASLTGGCFGTGIFRIYTEFLRRGRRTRPAGATGPSTPASGGLRDRRGQGRCRGIAAVQDVTGGEGDLISHAANTPLNARSPGGLFDRGRGRKTQRPASVPSSKPVDLAKPQRHNRVVAHLRFGRRGAHATVEGSVGASHCSFAALAHNSHRTAQHF